MPPKVKFTKDNIIDAAFDIAKQDGVSSITIRKVADKLGSSIAPIYVNFSDVGELLQAVIDRVREMNRQLVAQQMTGNPFLDVGMASLRFARDYPNLFRDLVLKEGNRHLNDQTDDTAFILEQMKQDPDLQGLADEELQGLLLKMKIFQTGLSVMAAGGLLGDDFDDQRALETMIGTATDLITAAHMRRA